MGPFSRLWALVVGVGQVGLWFSGLYEKVAAVFLFIAIVEAVWFSLKHFRRVRNFKTGWRQRMAPAHLSWITKSSATMCIIEPVMVGVLILLCGICVATIWPLWVPFVALVSTYDTIHYGIRKVKSWRSKLPLQHSIKFNKVKEFPWIYGDYDSEVIDAISREAMAKRTGNGDVTTASNCRRREKKSH